MASSAAEAGLWSSGGEGIGRRGGLELAFALHRLGDQLGDVEDLDLVASVSILDAVTEHDGAKGASGGDGGGAGGDDLVGAVVVHPRPDLLLHPHPPAAGAAAE